MHVTRDEIFPSEPKTSNIISSLLGTYADACSERDWYTLHKAWQPLFSPASLSLYQGLMEECARKLASRLEAASMRSSTRVDMKHEMGLMSLQVFPGQSYLEECDGALESHTG